VSLLHALLVALLVSLAPEAHCCDGDPPVLENRDDSAHEYETTCGAKVERQTIPAGGKQVLKGKGGCSIRLGDAPPTRLFAEMVCTIERGKLACDLL